MELVIGVEPTTCWLQISCSAIEPHQHERVIPLKKQPKGSFVEIPLGALRWNRTTDTRIFSPVLYRLSYQGKWRSGRDLNSRPLAWQASALTNWATRPNKFCKMQNSGKSHGVFYWWTFRDSNPGQTGYEPGALTNWAKGPLVGVEGLEPPASWSQAMRAANCATPRQYYAFYLITFYLSRTFCNFFWFFLENFFLAQKF